MLTFRYFKKHISRRRRSVLKLLLRSVSHHNLSADGMNNDESFSLIFAVGVSSYPSQVFMFFDECARWRYDENCLCRSSLRSAGRSSVSIFLINGEPIFLFTCILSLSHGRERFFRWRGHQFYCEVIVVSFVQIQPADFIYLAREFGRHVNITNLPQTTVLTAAIANGMYIST